MPEPRSIGPEKPSAIARSGVTTPMFTVRCFQMRLSVSSVSYSSTACGKRRVKSSMKSSRPAGARLVERSASFFERHFDAWYFGISRGRSR
jgi:hypothetical protein